MSSKDPLIDCYHELILYEYEKMQNCDFLLEDARSRLVVNEINKILTSYGFNLKELLAQGLLVEYPDSTFRTLHMDLIFRAVNLRAASWSPKIPLEFKIPKPRIENLPSFDEIELGKLKGITKLTNGLIEILCKSLRESNYDGLAFHQFYFLQKLLEEKYKCYMLVAPTASGKSLIFYLAILIDVLLRLDEKGTKAMILYPRKALATDQLFKFLKVICKINSYLSANGLRKITIGLDDGDTPRSSRSENVRRANVFRGIKCINSKCQSSLRYYGEKDRTLIVCENKKCGIVYDEILATKEDIWLNSPDIVFSNLSALNRRMMMRPAQNLLAPSLKWIVLDEAHTYREELGGHARWLLRRLDARFNVLRKGNIRFIISSATIPKPMVFASKLIGLPPKEIYYESYSEVLKSAKQKFRKLTLDVILAPNPLRSAESLAEELSLLLGVWGFTNWRKTVLFVDNVSEVERIYNFVVSTIIRERAAHNDHLNPSITPTVKDVSSSFSWRSVARNTTNIDPNQLANIYDFHHAELSSEERAAVENKFKSQNSGLIFSTSTLELGIDIGDIAAVVQYKVPLTSESYVQRVGRAGRSEKVFRVALGILVLTNSPSQVRYVLGDEYLRLINPEKIDPYIEIPVAWENEEIKRQHVTFSILDVLAATGNPTYLDYTTEVHDSWSGVQDVISSIKELLVQAENNLTTLKRYIAQQAGDIASVNMAESVLQRIKEKISTSASQLSSLDARSIDENLSKLRKAESSITGAVRSLQVVRRDIQSLLQTLKLHELQDHTEKLHKVEESLRKVLSCLERLMR
jgi:superfamily II DNA/RNA helicase